MASEEITEPETTATTTEDMDLENPNHVTEEASTDGAAKRDREEAEDSENGGAMKKQKVDNDEKSVEEVRMKKLEEVIGDDGEKEEENEAVEKSENPVSLGPKTFGSSVEMFEYFYQLLHRWPMNLKVNKYEHLALLDLIKKGHPEPEKKLGSGIDAFVIRTHPEWKSRCFFVMRADKSVEDFSFRKCVDHILPLPENMKIKTEANKALAGGGKKGGGGGRGGGRGHGRGRGGRGRRG